MHWFRLRNNFLNNSFIEDKAAHNKGPFVYLSFEKPKGTITISKLIITKFLILNFFGNT